MLRQALDALVKKGHVIQTAKEILDKDGNPYSIRLFSLPTPNKAKGPAKVEAVCDEICSFKETNPKHDWDKEFAEQEWQINSHKCPPD